MDGKLVNKNSVLSAMIRQANKKGRVPKDVQNPFSKVFSNVLTIEMHYTASRVYLPFILISMILLIKNFLQVYECILIENQTSAEGQIV